MGPGRIASAASSFSQAVFTPALPAQLLRPLALVGVFLVATAVWFIGYEKPPLRPQLEFTPCWAVWRHYLVLVSTAVGIGY